MGVLMNLIEVNGCDQLKYNLQFVAVMCCGCTNNVKLRDMRCTHKIELVLIDLSNAMFGYILVAADRTAVLLYQHQSEIETFCGVCSAGPLYSGFRVCLCKEQ